MIRGSCIRAFGILLLFAMVLSIVAVAENHPLSPQALANEVELYPFEGILPSPDGKWIAFETSDPTKKIQFDYESQRYTKSGYPMLASASAISVWVTELATGKSIQLSSPQGFSWSPNWSPDGTRLAYYSDRGGFAAVWVWDRRTGTSRQVSPAQVFFSWWKERPLWGADGKTILTKLLPEGMTLNDVLSLSPYYAALLNKKKGVAPDPKTATVQVYKFDPSDVAKPKVGSVPAGDDMHSFYDAMYLSDLARIDIDTGKVTRLVTRVRPMWFQYSPDQTQIAYLSMEGVAPKTQQTIFAVSVYSVATGETKEVARGFMDPNTLDPSVSWSPDGTRIAYSDTGKTAERAAYVVDVRTGKKLKVSDAVDPKSRTFTWGPALWDKSGQHVYLLDPEVGQLWEVAADGTAAHQIAKMQGMPIKDIAADEYGETYWSPDDGKTMYVRAHDNSSKKDAIYAVPLEGGQPRKVYEGAESIAMREMGAMTGTPTGGILLFSSESASRDSDIWALDVETGQRRQLSHLNPQYEGASMGQVRIIDWYSLQGEHLHGALLVPAGYKEGERYPMIVWVYGGDNGSDKANRFGFGWGGTFNFQIWASRGYAILYPDIPLHTGTPVDDLVSSVVPGVNKAVEIGVADPDRLALMGQSFGGYNTIALLTKTGIFKAAVATSAAATDLFMGYSYFTNGSAPWEGYYEEGQGGMKGSPWDLKTRYWDNSPFFFLDKVTTPLMIERGTDDAISIQSGNVFNGLKRLGKTVELLEYDHEGHVVQQPVNVIDFWNRRLAWVERYLGPDRESSKSEVNN